MPKLLVRPQTHSTPSADGEPVVELVLDGFIDAASYAGFERGLETAYRGGGRFLVLNFHDVHYINSTGISVLIRYFELYRERRGALCLAGVAREVGLSMHLLGVTSFLPFLKDVPTALEHVERMATSEPGDGRTTSLAELGAVQVPSKRRSVAGLEKARVLVVLPFQGRFTRVLRLRFHSLNGDYHLVHSAEEAIERYEQVAPDLVVVDNRCDEMGKLVRRIKLDKERSLTSVLKLYSKETDVERDLDFKIWENDYLIEPFEVLELFTLTEAELRRLPKDRKVLQQQVRFEFKSTRDNLAKAYKLCDAILRKALSDPDDSTALYAAVKEGVDNATIHGARFDEEKNIDVNILVDTKKITVIVEDPGEGFDFEFYLSRLDDDETFERAKRRILDENERGGLGILLMSKCADRLEYSGRGNVLRLEKNR